MINVGSKYRNYRKVFRNEQKHDRNASPTWGSFFYEKLYDYR